MNIRLEKWEIERITSSFIECFERKDRLWVFGSRAKLDKYGGDIDLYIEVMHFNFEKVYNQKQKFWVLLQDQLGEQKIDIIIHDPNKKLLIYEIARKEGIQLV